MKDLRDNRDGGADSRQALAAGLCASCCHCKTVSNARGSVFHLCRKSETDPAYAKYPRLPVLMCDGYRPAD